MSSDAVAVLVSDIHLSHKPPLARSAEPDWYAAMARQLRELKELAEGIPILCAGDVFDKWNSPPELINFAIDELPHMYCVPGQHDLPHHNLEDIRKTAYATLVKAGVITNIVEPVVIAGSRIVAYGAPWGRSIPSPEPIKGKLQVLVAHMYCHKNGFGFPGAPKEQNVTVLSHDTNCFDAAVFGDNHKGFLYKERILNHGTFYRRKMDEVNYQPQVGLLFRDGTIQRIPMATAAEDKFIDANETVELMEKAADMTAFLSDLSSLSQLDKKALDFMDSISHFVKHSSISKGVRLILKDAIENFNCQ